MELSPDLLDAHLQLGKFFLLARDLEKAMEKADLILAKDPENQAAVLLQASILIGQKKPAKAIALLNQLVKIGAEDPEIHLLLAAAFQQKGDAHKEEQAIKKGVEQNPDYTRYYFYLVRIYAEKGRMSDAIAAQQQLIALEPEIIDHQIRLANLYWEANGWTRLTICWPSF